MISEKWVIGIGNPLRGDDGAGWAVVEAFTAVATCPVQTLTTHQLLPELVDTIHAAEQVVFVDASVAGTPGSLAMTAVQPAQTGPASSHQLSPAVLLALGMELYGRMPAASLITITGQNFGYRQQLSPPVAQAVTEVAGMLKTIMY